MTDDSDPRQAFGRRLRQMREARGLSRPELAARSGLRADQVKHYEQATRSSPRLETICKLAHGLGCDPSELLETVPPLDVDTDRS